MKPAFGWCAVLAAVSDDVLGTALEGVAARHRARSPELLEVRHHRHHYTGEMGEYWSLYVAAVMGGAWEGDLADSHPALARDLWKACELWTHSFPTFRRLAPGHASLARYHRAPTGVVLPPPPAERPRPVHAAPPKRIERAAAEPAPVVAVPEQRGLFG